MNTDIYTDISGGTFTCAQNHSEYHSAFKAATYLLCLVEQVTLTNPLSTSRKGCTDKWKCNFPQLPPSSTENTKERGTGIAKVPEWSNGTVNF